MATTLTKDLEDMVNGNYHLEVGKINFQGFHHAEYDFPFTEYFRTLQGQRFAYNLCLVDLKIFSIQKNLSPVKFIIL